VGLQVRHEQRARNSLSGDVCQNDSHASGAQTEKVVIVSSYLTSLDTAAGIFHRAERRQLLWEQPVLYLPGKFHFLGGKPLNFDSLGDLFSQADVLERYSCLARDRGQQSPVFARIRLFGKPWTQHNSACQVAVASYDRHQALRQDGSEYRGFFTI